MTVPVVGPVRLQCRQNDDGSWHVTTSAFVDGEYQSESTDSVVLLPEGLRQAAAFFLIKYGSAL